MKINIVCKSIILQKTLNCYLREYITNYQDCDFVISDTIDEIINKPICLANFEKDSDIKRPICKESLFKDLDKFSKSLSEIPRINMEKINNILDLSELENLKQSIETINLKKKFKEKNNLKDEIEDIVRDFTEKLYKTIQKNNA